MSYVFAILAAFFECNGHLRSAGHASWPVYCRARQLWSALLSGTPGTCSSSVPQEIASVRDKPCRFAGLHARPSGRGDGRSARASRKIDRVCWHGLTPHPECDHIRSRLFQGRQCLRLDHDGLIVMKEAAPQRDRRREDRQNGDQTHTHTSPLIRGTHYW